MTYHSIPFHVEEVNTINATWNNSITDCTYYDVIDDLSEVNEAVSKLRLQKIMISLDYRLISLHMLVMSSLFTLHCLYL
jgi:hypothetical protein